MWSSFKYLIRHSQILKSIFTQSCLPLQRVCKPIAAARACPCSTALTRPLLSQVNESCILNISVTFTQYKTYGAVGQNGWFCLSSGDVYLHSSKAAVCIWWLTSQCLWSVGFRVGTTRWRRQMYILTLLLIYELLQLFITCINSCSMPAMWYMRGGMEITHCLL